MRAGDAGRLLSGIAKNGELELAAGSEALLDRLLEWKLIRAAPEPGPQAARLAALREQLVQMGRGRSGVTVDAAFVARERQLRTEILELSEEVARSESATVLRSSGGGPYRGGAAGFSRVQLTQLGRRALADLEPRLTRVEAMELGTFGNEMRDLRALFDERARRAAEIARHLRSGPSLGPARLAVPIGLSVLRADPAQAARAFDAAIAGVRGGAWGISTNPASEAALAECLCLAVGDLRHAEDYSVISRLVAMPHDLQRRFRVALEDALDATALLTHLYPEHREPKLALALRLSAALQPRGRSISLAYALIAVADQEQLPSHLPLALAHLDDVLARELRDAPERMAVAVLISAPGNDATTQLQRWRAIRQYLARVSPEGMSIAAALLAWLALEPAEILDDLRLASQALAKHGLAGTGAETVTLASKLVLAMAAMAAGAEGDPEERLALAPIATPALPLIGLQGVLAALPLTAVNAFHHTVLTAATAWERSYHPTHSSYVFGGGSSRRSYGHYRG